MIGVKNRMKKSNYIVLAMLLMGLVFFVNIDTASADPGVIYVNGTSGNDAWNGESQFYTNGTNGPKKTIGNGTGLVTANGIVNIANGIYSGTGNVGLTLDRNMTIKGQSKDGTIINGSDASRIFTINTGVNVTLLNLTIANGRAPNSNGGSIQNGGTLTINNCTFKNNAARRTSGSTDVYGGAIYNTGTLKVSDSSFINNVVLSGGNNHAQGGAIYSIGVLIINNSVFTGNNVSSSVSSKDDGGAIWASGTLIVSGSNFTSNNAAGYGGGAICIGDNVISAPNVSITDSNFVNNTAGYGGAIWTNGGTASNPVTIKNSTFTGNRADYGGAIRNWGFLSIEDSIFTNNSAREGGALNNYNSQGTSILNVTGSTLTRNSANTGSAIYNTAGTSNIHFNQIINNTGNFDVYAEEGTVNATNNWWGSNTNISSRVSGNVNITTWLVLKLTASPITIPATGNSTITADLNHDQNGVYYDPADGHIPDGTPITFTSTLGTINSAVMTNGTATATFRAGTVPGVATITAKANGYSNSTNVTINALANIVINQTVNTPVNVGDKVTFLVTATNNGPNTATNINIRDIIPTGLTGVIVTPSVGIYNTTTGIWAITSLLNGSSAVLDITGTASASMAGIITNNTATEISQTENSTLIPTNTAGVYTKMADVQMSQTSTTPVNVGGNVTYIVRILNIGPDAATNFVIQDIIPAGLLNVVVTPSTGTYSIGNWTIPILANGDFATLTITGMASASMAGKNTTNTATKIFETEYDPTTFGESVSADAYTKQANVVLTQTGSYNKNNVTFIVTAKNNGPDTATNINISDVIPAGLTNVIVTPSVGTYSNGVWYIPALASGSRATLNISGNTTVQSTIINVAKIALQDEYNPNNGSSTYGVYVPAVDLWVRNYEWFAGRNDTYSFNEAPIYVS